MPIRKRHNKAKYREYFYGRRQLQALRASKPASASLMMSSSSSTTITAGPPASIGANIQFSPTRMTIRLSEVKLVRAGGLQLSEGMRLIGESSTQDSLTLTRVSASGDMLNSILAVLHVPEEIEQIQDNVPINGNFDSRLLFQSNVAGFLCVVAVDVDVHDTLTVLSPCPGQLPSKYLLVGSGLKWVE
jgi:hypothetical protein